MIEIILGGVCAVLYLAGLYVAAEYTEVMEKIDAKAGIPRMSDLQWLWFVALWPYYSFVAMFTGGKDDE